MIIRVRVGLNRTVPLEHLMGEMREQARTPWEHGNPVPGIGIPVRLRKWFYVETVTMRLLHADRGKFDQVRQVVAAAFGHDMGPMDFNRAVADTQLAGNFLAG